MPLFGPNIEKIEEKKDVDGLVKALGNKDWRALVGYCSENGLWVVFSEMLGDCAYVFHVYDSVLV